jgi:large subunit ribosomal protein L24
MALRIRRNDIVRVVSGDELGKSGRVLEILDGGRLVVEGVNYVWKHLRRSQQHPHGARIQKEAPLSASSVMLVCPSCSKTTRIAHRVLEGGEKVRACRKCRQPIPAPAE